MRVMGHVIRRQGFENLCLTGKIEVTRAASRRERLKYLKSVFKRMALWMSPNELLKYTQDQASTLAVHAC